MRINRYIAQATGLSRRAADTAISHNRVSVNGQPASTGHIVLPSDIITLDEQPLAPLTTPQTIIFNKPAGYVVSRDGQGSKTIYDLLPPELHNLKPVGRLDKDSSGLLLLTNDGQLAQNLTHPSFQKEKVYEVVLEKPLRDIHRDHIEQGVSLEDGLSSLRLRQLHTDPQRWQVTMTEGRNRQIRRTFAALGYRVLQLHRTHFGPFSLGDLPLGQSAPAPDLANSKQDH